MTIKEFKTVGVQFDGTGRYYTYKTLLHLAIGDKVVVDVNGVYKVVDVVEVHSKPKIDPKATFAYKWIVSKVDLDGYKYIKKLDAKPLVKKPIGGFFRYEVAATGEQNEH